MKNFKFLKSLLVLIGVLITSLTTNVWGWALYGNFYFDNSTKQWSNVSLCIGTSSGSNAYVFSHIDNTNLWYRQLDYSSFGNAIFLNGNWTDENWWSGYDYRPEGRTWSLSSDDKWEIYNTNYNTKNSDNSMKSYRFNGSDNSSASGELEFHTAYLRVKYDERDGNGYGSIIEGETTWSHGVTFDFTGTYLTSASASTQTKISSLTKNCWTDGSQKWGYENIPHTGEVRFELKGISTGFELEGWAYASDATSPSYTTNPGDVTFNVTGSTMYVAMVRRKQYTVTLNRNGGSSGTASVTTTYDKTYNLTSSITKPSKDGYTFKGYWTNRNGTGTQLIDKDGAWIKDVTGYTGSDNGNPKWVRDEGVTLYAKWTQTISLNQNGATVEGTDELAATFNGVLSTGGITNPNKIGYAFAGWATAADGDVVIEPNGTVNDVADWTEDGKWIHAGESELVATWTADVNNFKADAATTAWGTVDNWSQNKVPTEYTEVHIKGNATVSSHVYVGKVVIEEGSLTIASTGALEVASTITNTDEDKLVVNSRGALIFDNSAGSTYATVELSTTYASAGSHFQFIGLPVWGVSVSTAFAGKGVYTYAWKQGEGWERRGYYDDLMAFEAIALMGSSGYTFHGALVPTTDKEYSLSYAARENGDVYMYGNSWTAPIKVSGMTIDSYDGAHIYDGSTGSWDGAVSGDVIPAMQAFAVLAKSGTGGSVSIPYNTAVRNATSPNAPLRAPQRNTSDILDHISVYVTGNELQTRMRLFENEQFTNDIDNGYEAIHMEGEGRAGELYAQADDKMTVLATPNLEGTVVGFIPGEATNYTISFEGDGKGYYLNDVVTNQSTLIAEGNTYMFTPDESTNDTRFIISKTPIHNMPTGVDAINDGVKARKQMINGILYIIRDGRLYDATGALVK